MALVDAQGNIIPQEPKFFILDETKEITSRHFALILKSMGYRAVIHPAVPPSKDVEELIKDGVLIKG
jgi:hypothetical protein